MGLGAICCGFGRGVGTPVCSASFTPASHQGRHLILHRRGWDARRTRVLGAICRYFDLVLCGLGDRTPPLRLCERAARPRTTTTITTTTTTTTNATITTTTTTTTTITTTATTTHPAATRLNVLVVPR